MSTILIPVTGQGATIEDLPLLPASKRKRSTGPSCPHCGGTELKHHVLSRWHTCKALGCRQRFQADCSRHKHGGSLG